MSMIQYTTPQGTYAGVFEYDPDADLFHGEVVNVGATLTFQGRSIDELKTALKDTVDDYIDWCAERGKEPLKPFSGQIPLRLGPELHRDVAAEATRERKSVNQLVKDVLIAHLGRVGAPAQGQLEQSRTPRGYVARVSEETRSPKGRADYRGNRRKRG